MQCSCCHSDSDNLRKYSLSAVDELERKTIQTLFLCSVCRIIYLIKPKQIALRAAQAATLVRAARRAA